MILAGFHAVGARLKRAPGTIRELYVATSRDDARTRELLARAQAAGVRVLQADVARLDRLAPARRHQGVVAMAEGAPPAPDLEALLAGIEGPPLLLLLDGVTDPRNLGACLRVADGAGAHAVIAPKDHAAPLSEVAMQTASGAAETMPYLLVTNLPRTIDRLQEAGVWVVGTADEASTSLYDAAMPQALAWVLGAEGKGLRRLVRERCDQLVRIPMAGTVESLNVAVAAGVVLFESVRQRAQRAVPAR